MPDAIRIQLLEHDEDAKDVEIEDVRDDVKDIKRVLWSFVIFFATSGLLFGLDLVSRIK